MVRKDGTMGLLIDATVISESCRLKGNVETSGTLTIAGSFEGIINCASLETCRDSRVKASVEVDNVTIGGFFEGDMVCNGRLTIARTGTVKGRISYGSLAIESGGLLEGYVSKLELRDTKLIPFRQVRI